MIEETRRRSRRETEELPHVDADYVFDIKKFKYGDLKDIPAQHHKVIANKLIDAGKSLAVLENLSLFKGLDHAAIADKIIEARQGFAVVVHLSSFEGLDHADIIDMLIKSGQGYVVAENLSSFEGLDHADIANKLIEGGYIDEVIENLFSFYKLTNDIAGKLIKAGYSYSVAIYLSHFIFDHVDHDFGDIICQETCRVKNSISALFTVENYNHIIKLAHMAQKLQQEKLLEKIKKLLGDREEVLRRIQKQLKKKNYGTAKEIIGIAVVCGYDEDELCSGLDIEKERLDTRATEEYEMRESGELQREIYQDMNIEEEMIQFYIYRNISSDMVRLEERFQANSGNPFQYDPFEREFPFKEKVVYFDIQTAMQRNTRRLFDSIRKYIVVAVASEMKHQFDHVVTKNTMYHAVDLPCSSDARHALTYMSEEQIRHYLGRTQIQFDQFTWDEEYGGKAWSAITAIAQDMWSTREYTYQEMETLLDRMFQIQHNTGMVFDKDKEHIYHTVYYRQILDIKSQKLTLNELYRQLKNRISDTDVQKKMAGLVSRWDALMGTPLRGQGD